MEGLLRNFRTDGTVQHTKLHGRLPTLEELQAVVGGYIEMVPYIREDAGGRKIVCFANEEGLLKRLPKNPDLLFRGLIVGDVAVLSGDPEWWEKYHAEF